MKIHTKSNIIISLFFIISGSRINASKSQENEKDTSTITSRRSGQIKFEDSGFKEDTDLNLGNSGFKFEDDTNNHELNNPGRVTFLEDNKIDLDKQVYDQNDIKVENPGKKKKKRRRRKPRYQRPNGTFPPGPHSPQYSGPGAIGENPYPGLPFPPSLHYPSGPVPVGQSPYPGLPGLPQPGIPGPPYLGFGPGGPPTGQYYRPPRRRKPSFASGALTAVTGALTSIALYDDYQCVPRLLCEAAGGGALGSSGVLQNIAGLQPLLTLLSAYNGISNSPLFIFGRAVFLGMTAKGNTASCRYAYPQCPTDPEQLVHYLNNHNGGFFRFFNNPQQNPQNLQQFYQQLSLNDPQNLGSIPQNQQDQFFEQNLSNYPNQQSIHQGLQQNLQNGPNPLSYQQGYGLEQFPNGNQNHYGLYRPYPNQYPQQNSQYSQFQNVPMNPYSNNGYGYLQNYGKKYPYSDKYGFYNIKFKDNGGIDNKIQRRIQNKPNYEYVDSNNESTESDQLFKFPDDKRNVYDVKSTRNGKLLKFPEENVSDTIQDVNVKRKVKGITFPKAYRQDVSDENSMKITNEYLNYPNLNIRDTALDNYLKYYSYYHGEALSVSNNNYNSNISTDDKNIETVYIVRGNGDPNNPEIVKIRPGERVL